jgi:hypothetical protein
MQSSIISRPVKSFTVIKKRKMEVLRGEKVTVRDGIIVLRNADITSSQTYAATAQTATANSQTAISNASNVHSTRNMVISDWESQVSAHQQEVADYQVAMAPYIALQGQEDLLMDQYVGSAGSNENQAGFQLHYDFFLSYKTSNIYPELPNYGVTGTYVPKMMLSNSGEACLAYCYWCWNAVTPYKPINRLPGQVTYSTAANGGYGYGWTIFNNPRDYIHWERRPAQDPPTAPGPAPARPAIIDTYDGYIQNYYTQANTYSNQAKTASQTSATYSTAAATKTTTIGGYDTQIAADNVYIGKLELIGGAEEVIKATEFEHNKAFVDAIERQIKTTKGE